VSDRWRSYPHGVSTPFPGRRSGLIEPIYEELSAEERGKRIEAAAARHRDAIELDGWSSRDLAGLFSMPPIGLIPVVSRARLAETEWFGLRLGSSS
jgi:hypothetical protein